MTLEPIDLHHQGVERSIGVYLLETNEGLALFDCGPSTAVDALKAGLAARGVALADVRHLLLSHIHLDHAGAAGMLVREQPRLRVHVSEVGASHLVDPSRLVASSRRLYGDAFDVLWGEVAPIPEENVAVVGDHVLGLACFPTPGHADHHVVYLDDKGTLYAGDVCGVRIVPERLVLPPVPPPEIDVAAWDESLDEIERRAPLRLALIHFGVVEADVVGHLSRLRERLHAWEELVERGLTEQEFDEAMRADVEAELGRSGDAYLAAAPPGAYQGLKRWVEKVKNRPRD